MLLRDIEFCVGVVEFYGVVPYISSNPQSKHRSDTFHYKTGNNFRTQPRTSSTDFRPTWMTSNPCEFFKKIPPSTSVFNIVSFSEGNPIIEAIFHNTPCPHVPSHTPPPPTCHRHKFRALVRPPHFKCVMLDRRFHALGNFQTILPTT